METVTQPLWSYPLVFRRIKRVDNEFGYLYQNGHYTPLKRNSGACEKLFPWLKMGEWCVNYDPIAPMMYFEPYTFTDIDEMSRFFTRFVDVTVDELDYWQNGLKNIANCGVSVEECAEFINKLTPPRENFFNRTIQQSQKSGSNSVNIQVGGNLNMDKVNKIFPDKTDQKLFVDRT
jgi:hypothetical protein